MIKFYKIFILGFILCISSLVNLWGDLSTGLIAWYPFDGNASDMSGSENHATVYGPVLGADRHGQPNKAYVFDGVDDYILLPDNDLIELNGTDHSIGLWFIAQSHSTEDYSRQTLISKRSTSTSWGIGLTGKISHLSTGWW